MPGSNDLRPPQSSASVIGERTPQALLVSYDIADDRRRTRLHRLLKSYGEALQRSVYICWVDERSHRRLKAEIESFRAMEHREPERIDMLPIRSGVLQEPRHGWFIE